MKALIIAAGNGTRMQPVTRGRHKSLMSLLGLKIIERVILGAKEAGIREFVIVTGYKGDVYQGAVGDGSSYGVRIKYVQNNAWKKPNGISALKAKDLLTENFVLLMSDHVFDPSTLKALLRTKPKDKESILVIDKNLESPLDIDDTTKVKVAGGKALAIGKNLEHYSAYDTGMFYCSPYIFKCLEEAVLHGNRSLSDGMRILIREQRLRVLDNSGNFWADCDTYADIKFAEKKLLKTLSKPTDYYVSRNVNRRVSIFISRFLALTPITPNKISLSVMFLSVVTGIFLAKGTYPWLLVGGLLIQLISILDGCDGEIARLKFVSSKWGAWFDGAMDKYVDTIIVAGLSYGYWRTSGNNLIWPIAIFVLLGLITDSYMHMKFKSVVAGEIKFKGLSVERDFWLLALAFGAVFDQVLPVMIFLLIFMHYKVIGRLVTAKSYFENSKKLSSVLI